VIESCFSIIRKRKDPLLYDHFPRAFWFSMRSVLISNKGTLKVKRLLDFSATYSQYTSSFFSHLFF
jgi:hypothetical protein